MSICAERKISDANKQDMIYLTWKECIPTEFFKYICEEENFIYLNGKTVIYSKVADMLLKFLETDSKNFVKVRDNLYQFKTFFNISVQLPIQTFNVQPRSADLISRALSMLRLINTKIKKIVSRQEKIQKNLPLRQKIR